MKSLRQSLIDYDLALLKGIAGCRGIPLPASKQAAVVDQLAEALLSPATVAIALADLAEEERAALQLLLAHHGKIEAPRFTREFGPVRPMGPARLEREKPWRAPVNPAERLWYKGLIFKGFQMTEQGNLQFIYIPTDLLPLLEMSEAISPVVPPPTQAGTTSLAVAQSPHPAEIVSGAGRLSENIFSLLVYLQTTPVRLQPKNQLLPKDRDFLTGCLLPPLLPSFTPPAELDFLLHLGQRSGLLIVSHSRLKPDPDPTRAWLQAPPAERERLLQNAWQADPTWNDLWHVPGLVPQPTGWENSPLLARSKILDYLLELKAAPDTWFSLADFIAAIKRIDPDFQRPSGDYDSWYIHDDQGRSLMGFEHWDEVEGALIRYLLTHLLPLLGVVELGQPAAAGSPLSFRITPSGASFLSKQAATLPAGQKPQFLQVDAANFNAHVPVQASLYDRFQLARFAELDRREPGRAVYRITQASVGRALRNGVTTEQMVAFLGRATNNQTPLKVVEMLRTWGTRRGAAYLEPATLLRLKHEGLVAELRQHPQLGPLLGEVIGPKTILIPGEKVKEVRRLLAELGYLEF
ncbi:MAG: helicase-associated domain-containing protein [Chloroflexota bacterium]